MVAGLYTDGFLIGSVSARSMVTAGAADWGSWVPGDTAAAQLLLGTLGAGDGLRDLLADAGVTIRSVADTKLDALGKALAEGAGRGDSTDTLARDIAGVLSDPARAEMIATTELCRAVSAAGMATYLANGIEQVEWASAADGRVCAVCQTNSDAGSRRPGAPFPSGDAAPPAHPLDRCALVPVTSTALEVT